MKLLIRNNQLIDTFHIGAKIFLLSSLILVLVFQNEK